MLVVSGTILFGADLNPFVGATVYARIEDAGRADARAQVVAESVLPSVAAGGPPPVRIEFKIEAPLLEPRAGYGIRVHVDVDGDGRVGIGDYVSTASHPLQSGGHSTRVTIPVKRVS